MRKKPSVFASCLLFGKRRARVRYWRFLQCVLHWGKQEIHCPGNGWQSAHAVQRRIDSRIYAAKRTKAAGSHPGAGASGRRTGIFHGFDAKFFRQIPDALEEAAFMDGAGHVRTLAWRIAGMLGLMAGFS